MLLERASSIYKRMSHAAMRAGRGPQEVRLVAVSKTVGLDAVQEAIDAGLRVFGENRVQEARDKIEALASRGGTPRLEWHLIGHLQKNKARQAVRLFDLIHTLDSRELGDEIEREAEKLGKVQRVLIQVKLSEEETKSGADPAEVLPLLQHAEALRHVRVEGLMTMPPYFEDPEAVRPYFAELRDLREKLEGRGFSLPELSMGMSHDFEAAIEEGATLVRVGTALFGERRPE